MINKTPKSLIITDFSGLFLFLWDCYDTNLDLNFLLY